MDDLQKLIKIKEDEYKEYIDNHRSNVKHAWEKLKNNKNTFEYIDKNKSISPIEHFLPLIDSCIENHDRSKYSKEEFNAYRKYFYPVSEDEKELAEKEFDEAWKHHYTWNMHHWDWWYHSGIENSMPFIFVIEMICDWMAMSYHFNNSTKEWYYNEKQNGKIHLGERQTKWVEDILELI